MHLDVKHAMINLLCLLFLDFFVDSLMWTDESLVDYVNWLDGEPGMDNCVAMTSEGWGMEDCMMTKHYVCKSPVCKSMAVFVATSIYFFSELRYLHTSIYPV